MEQQIEQQREQRISNANHAINNMFVNNDECEISTLGGSYLANRKSAALIAYRLEQLEQKVQAHNNLVERTYKLEERTELQEEKIKVANHRIDDLEGFHKPA